MTRQPFDLRAGVPRRPRPAQFASEPVSRGRPRAERWEPGFLRLPPGRQVRPLSFIVDRLGAHFDATAPSELERLLEREGWEAPELLERARAGLARLRAEALSLDNAPWRRPFAPSKDAPCVVVVDQPRDDPAAGFGLAGPDRFGAMLAAAIAENPDAEIVVAPDPASRAAAEEGRLLGGRLPAGVRAERRAVCAWSLAEAAARLYTVSAHVGLEALAAGKPVTCFGAPFYAGWGLTDDRLRLSRRTRRRSLQEVFAAACLVSSRYFDPYDGGEIAFEQALDILSLCVRRERENARPTLCVGFAGWKRGWAQAVLGSEGARPTLAPYGDARLPPLAEGQRVVSWASREPSGLADSSHAAGAELLRMEDGFLRSVGLGVALRPGASYVLDGRGMYYDASRPSDLEVLLQTADFPPPLLERAARLRAAIVEGGVSKYNVGGRDLPRLPADRRVVLVAGQVENDASIRLGAVQVEGTAGLLERARADDPDAFIAFKPHPDVEAGLRPGRIHARRLESLCDAVLRDCSAVTAIDAADRVEVATSLLGFEALLRGKPVTTRGLPFYAGWGLTADPGCDRRTRRLTLDELVAGALILYPRYIDPVTQLPCEPEVVVARLAEAAGRETPRERTPEALLKRLWSAGFRAAGGAR